MLNLPWIVIELLNPFAPIFYGVTTWEKAKILLVGAILAPGKRTVSSVLRVMGLGEGAKFAQYHQVLNRAVWSSLEASRVLLLMVVSRLWPGDKPLVVGMDETIERRWGQKIQTRGIYRDAVRSSKSHKVKVSGLRWISLMALIPVAWAERVWALPFLTASAPSERYYEQRGRQPKTIIARGWQMIAQLRRWLPDRRLVMVGDSSYAVIDLLHNCQSLTNPVTVITRLRLDAALYEPAPVHQGSTRPKGRPRKKGKRLPNLEAILIDPETVWQTTTVHWYGGTQRAIEWVSQTAVWYHPGKPPVPVRWVLIRDPLGEFVPQAMLSTNLQIAPVQIVEWFVLRWRVEVTFEEVRTHLGVETQRQWSDLAIARTTPALLALFSWITLLAHALITQRIVSIRSSAWYSKTLPTFSDAIAWVRSFLWPITFYMSPDDPDMVLIPRSLLSRLTDTLCYAA
jgi:hypothetical protein